MQRVALRRQLLGPQSEDRHGTCRRHRAEVFGVERLDRVGTQFRDDPAADQHVFVQLSGVMPACPVGKYSPMTGMPRAWQALVSFEKTSTLAASRCSSPVCSVSDTRRDVHAFAQGVERIVREDAFRAGVFELEAVDRVPIEPHDGQRAFRAGENAAAVPNHARCQQDRVDRPD